MITNEILEQIQRLYESDSDCHKLATELLAARKTTEQLTQQCVKYVEINDRLLLRIAELKAERDEADRHAGAAQREKADYVDSQIRRNTWLDKAKREWGADRNVSFDVVWEEALKLKAAARKESK